MKFAEKTDKRSLTVLNNLARLGDRSITPQLSFSTTVLCDLFIHYTGLSSNFLN